ncbi:hypothetical protein CLOM_g15394 [Closterium sp. NIES-68]|nr:hypothetical protein CLOM_g15394 [Closterium sp. NIES-68]GJP65679.1 hypothetical protein CLOP_g22545 [Closterium sp. NIES-67]
MAVPTGPRRTLPLLLLLLLSALALLLAHATTAAATKRAGASAVKTGATPVISSAVAASAVKALLLSNKYSKAAPYLQILVNTINTVNATVNAPYTLLVPLEALDYCTTIKKYPSQQLLALMAYHIVKGRYTYANMKGFKNGKALSTISGRALTRVTKKFMPMLVVVAGQANDEAVVLAGDVYSTKTVTVHIISKMLQIGSV